MTKKDKDYTNWIVASWVFGITTVFLFTLLAYFPEETSAYQKGFEDGQQARLNENKDNIETVQEIFKINNNADGVNYISTKSAEFMVSNVADWDSIEWLTSFCFEYGETVCLYQNGTWSASWRDK